MHSLSEQKKEQAGTASNKRQDNLTPMKTSHYLGDALTAVSINITVNIAGIITYFYTDVMGVAVGVVGTVMLVAKLVDAFTDIGMGIIIDRTRSKYGKARPWLLRMAFPALVSIVLMFTFPTTTSVSAQFIYILASNMLMGAIVSTSITVSSGSLLSLETKNAHERSKMGIWRLIFAYAAGMIVSSLLVPVTNLLGGGRSAWLQAGVIYGVISAASLVAAFSLIRERNTVAPVSGAEKTPLMSGLISLFKNKYWVIALAVNILIQITYAVIGIETYYMKYIFGNENLVAEAGLYRLGFVAAGFLLSGLFIRRFGKRNVVLAGTAVAIAGFILRAANPYNLALNLLGIGIATLGGVPSLAVIGSMVADSIEYGEWKTGKRMVGLASSAHSFSGSLAAAIWAGAIGWLLALCGYDGISTIQPESANQMIIFLNIYLPLICHVITFVMMLFYDLDKNYLHIMEELDSRRKMEDALVDANAIPKP